MDGAVNDTTKAIKANKSTALFEAGFIAHRTRIRADIMVRLESNNWELWEVKAVGTAQDKHLIDLAIQVEIIKQWSEDTGIPLNIVRCGIIHLNKDYVYPGGEYNLNDLFTETDCTDLIWQYHEEVLDLISCGISVIDDSKTPVVLPGNHCTDPYVCPFLGTMCEIPPIDELSYIPNFGPVKTEKLHSDGIHDLEDLSNSEYQLNLIQQRALKAELTGERQVDPNISNAINDLGYPRFHLDFETTGSSMIIPVYPGSHPFQSIPFQFSLHIETAPGKTASQDGYLHKDGSDPRRPLAESLIKMVNELPGKILMYSSYEKTVLNGLKSDLPDLADEIDAIIDRLVDLLPILRNHIYDPEFKGSFSIKKVLPALVKGKSYASLEIQGGDIASIKYFEMIELMAGDEDDRKKGLSIYNALWLYCKQDTQSMVGLVGVLGDMNKEINGIF